VSRFFALIAKPWAGVGLLLLFYLAVVTCFALLSDRKSVV
jgi:hypothetical protein